MSTSTDLLFGLLALQTGLIQQAQLVAAFHAWTCDRSRSLADHLIALGHFSAAQKAVVEALAEIHVEAHSGNVERSLTDIPVGKFARESLAKLGDSDINATLCHVGSSQGSTEHDGELNGDRTIDYSVGSVTSTGQRFRMLRPHARGGLASCYVPPLAGGRENPARSNGCFPEPCGPRVPQRTRTTIIWRLPRTTIDYQSHSGIVLGTRSQCLDHEGKLAKVHRRSPPRSSTGVRLFCSARTNLLSGNCLASTWSIWPGSI